MSKRPEVTLNYHLQGKSRTFRSGPVSREVDTCRSWFFTEFETWDCLWRLVFYIEHTKQRGDLPVDERPTHLTRLLVQQKVESWLSEDYPEGIALLDQIRWLEARLKIAEDAFRFGDRHKEKTGPLLKEFSTHVATVANVAIERLKKTLTLLRGRRTRERTRMKEGIRRPTTVAQKVSRTPAVAKSGNRQGTLFPESE